MSGDQPGGEWPPRDVSSVPNSPPYPPPPSGPPQWASPAPHASPLYPAPSPYGVPPARPQNGALSWGLAFLAYLPIPLFNFVITAIVVTAVYRSVSRGGAVARENARNAVNWAWTAILLIVVSALLTGILGSTIPGDTRWVAGIFGLAFLAVGTAYAVLAIMGLIRASKGRALTVPFVIPFIRR